jgi:ABC-type polysaccharide/polyol phosphate export permease
MERKRRTWTSAIISEVWGWRSLIASLAFQKTIARYRSSLLGPAWMVLGFAIFAVGLSMLWSALQHVPLALFLPYVSLGLLAWNIVQGVLNEGTRCLAENRSLIHQSRAPLLVYPLVTMMKQVLFAAHALVVVIPVLVICNVSIGPNAVWLIPGVILLLVTATSVAVSLAIIGAYFPDMSELVSSMLRFAFFFTPVFWIPSMRPDLSLVWSLNPFYYAVESIRGPLLGTSDPVNVMSMLAIIAAASTVASMLIYSAGLRGARRRV